MRACVYVRGMAFCNVTFSAFGIAVFFIMFKKVLSDNRNRNLKVLFKYRKRNLQAKQGFFDVGA